MNICIFGASARELERSYYDAAFEMGEAIAKHGDGIVFGGGAEGLIDIDRAPASSSSIFSIVS